MAHKCFISFKMEDEDFKIAIQEDERIDMIDKSLKEPIDSDDEDYIMDKIRNEYLKDSTVTIFLIGEKSKEDLGWNEQRFIKRELQGSLYNGRNNTKSGVLGVVLPNMYDGIFGGSGNCKTCGNNHTYVNLNNSTTISEFSYNYYIPTNKCAWSEDDRYCVLVKWDDFINFPNTYIDQAFEKRDHEISKKTKVRP
jgi:hypothetical protein